MFRLWYIIFLFLGGLQNTCPTPIAVELKLTTDIYRKHDFNNVRSTLQQLSLEIAESRGATEGDHRRDNVTTDDAAQTNGLFEGDIVLSPRQLERVVEEAHRIIDHEAANRAGNGSKSTELIDEMDEIPAKSAIYRSSPKAWRPADTARGRDKRKIVYSDEEKWSTHKPIPYGFYPGLYANTKKVVRRAIQVWQANTCLRFEERKDVMSRDYSDDRILFFEGDGCYSAVGREGGLQSISIGVGCDTLGIVEHEIGHSLGMWHEQSRPDRDAHVEILWRNVPFSREANFLTSDSQTYSVPYDYGSVMHYAPQDFAYGGKNTIVTKDRNYMRTIGQRVRLSFFDIKVVNMAYCSRICTETISCQNGGYQDPLNCTQCKCPEQFSGTLCNEIGQSTMATCETRTLLAQETPQTVSYADIRTGRCMWHLKPSSEGNTLHVSIDNIDLACGEPCYVYLEVKTGDAPNGGFGGTGPRLCCQNWPNKTISTNDSAVIILESDYDASFYRGFRLQFWETTQSNTTKATEKPKVESLCWSDWSPWSSCMGLVRVRYRKCYCDCRSGSALEIKGCEVNNQQPTPPTPTESSQNRPCSKSFSVDCSWIRSDRIRDYFPHYTLVKSVPKPGLIVKMQSAATCTIDVDGTCEGKTFKPTGTPRLPYTAEPEIQIL